MEKTTSWIKRAYRRYVVDGMGGMALGLFASLLIGTIVKQIAVLPYLAFLVPLADVASNPYVVGAAIGAAAAMGLKVKPLAVFSAAVTGAIGWSSGGGPIGALVAGIVGAEVGNLVAGKTRVDIVLVPLCALLAGGLVGLYLGPPLDSFMRWLGRIIGAATAFAPVPMGMIMALSVGLALTGPISSAALAAMIFQDLSLPGVALAAGAATVGCCSQMIGFAVASYRENKFGGLLAQGLGTSKLQLPNVFLHPQILIPATLAGVILGPLATTVFQMTNAGISAGMGTCGLVGQLGTFTTMTEAGMPFLSILWRVALLHFVLPAGISLACSEFMRKRGWIKPGDMKLTLQ